MADEVRELIRSAQEAEVQGNLAQAVDLLLRAAAVYRESGRSSRALQILRHALRLDASRADIAAEVRRLEGHPGDPVEAPAPRAEEKHLIERGPTLADPDQEAWCSFCCRPNAEVGRLVAGPAGAFICAGCLREAQEMLGPGSDTAPLRELVVHRLGRVEYEDGLKLQELMGAARREGLIPDTLLLLEHPPVLTLGRRASRDNILAAPDVLAARGIEVLETNRGGEVTYHGPGQLVGYPVFLLSPDRQDVRKYVRSLEASLIAALAQFGIRAGHIPRWPGVWLGEEGAPDARKIAAVGVHLSNWLTSHGFALNVTTDISAFRLIVPCGIQEAGVTSMERELGWAPAWPEVETAVARSFGAVFGARLSEGPGPALRTISVAVLDDAGQVLLVRRRPERGGFWQILTGRIEPGETPAEAAAREAWEETGAPLDVEPLDYRHTFALGDELPPRLVEETAFAARWPQGHPVRLSDTEHDAHRWVSVDEALATLPFQGLKEAVRRARSRTLARKQP